MLCIGQGIAACLWWGIDVDECNMDALLAYNTCRKASMLVKETSIRSGPTEALLMRHWLLWESNMLGLNWLGSSKAQFVNFSTSKIKATFNMGQWVQGLDGVWIKKIINCRGDYPFVNQKHGKSIFICFYNCMMPVYDSVEEFNQYWCLSGNNGPFLLLTNWYLSI